MPRVRYLINRWKSYRAQLENESLRHRPFSVLR